MNPRDDFLAPDSHSDKAAKGRKPIRFKTMEKKYRIGNRRVTNIG
jgi:hypothetical protein